MNHEQIAAQVMMIIRKGNAEMWPTNRFGEEIAFAIEDIVSDAVDDARSEDNPAAACATGPCCN